MRLKDVSKEPGEQFIVDIEQLEPCCKKHRIPKPTTFCYPGYRTGQEAMEVLLEKCFRAARRFP